MKCTGIENQLKKYPYRNYERALIDFARASKICVAMTSGGHGDRVRCAGRVQSEGHRRGPNTKHHYTLQTPPLPHQLLKASTKCLTKQLVDLRMSCYETIYKCCEASDAPRPRPRLRANTSLYTQSFIAYILM